jgi:hypothetical protein
MVQDWIYSACMVVFVVALLPQVLVGVRYGQTVSLWASVPTAIALYVLAGTVYTSGYVVGCLMQSCCAALWSVLAVQRIVQLRNTRKVRI